MFLSPFCSEMFQFEDAIYIGTYQSEEQAKAI